MKCLIQILGIVGVLVTLTAEKIAAQNLNTTSPIDFFTNVASRLLSSQLNMDLTRIEIYPTNQYTPAVHRLLQVAANVYDATTTNFYPSVFRPTFNVVLENGCTNVYINGYEQVASVTGTSDAQFDLPVSISKLASDFGPGTFTNVNVYGLPWIIGAKKGFPNFNEYAMESAFQLTRKLQVTRASTNDTYVNNPGDYNFNQMFLLNLTNQLGVECWNSYTNSFNDPVAVYVTDDLTVMLTNDENLATDADFLISGFLQIPNATNSVWPGYNPAVYSPLTPASFQIPLNTSVACVPFSIYRFNGGNPFLTTNLALPFETNVMVNGSAYLQPHWWLMTTNNLRVIILDGTNVIDYVQLSGPNSGRDLTAEITNQWDTGNLQGYNDLWDTNIVSRGVPLGVDNQIAVSLGDYGISNLTGAWNPNNGTPQDEIDEFRTFFGMGQLYFDQGANEAIANALTTNAIQAPFTPTATVVQHIIWQVNDPLVHYLASDLNWDGTSRFDITVDDLTNENLGQLNQHYMPWGGHQPINPNLPDNPNTLNAYNLAVKDPLVWQSDDWDFPNGQTSNLDWIGRVHRGTPWQTIYLKSDVAGLSSWENWTGSTNDSDARLTHPTNDWHLASLLASLLNTNDFRSLLSVNDSDPDAWLVLLDGLTAWTNSLPDNQAYFGNTPQFDTIVISSNSPQASILINAIESARANEPNQFFHDVGDILAAAQLTGQSPYLNWNDGTQQEYGISDEAYEKIPSQLLPRLRADSVGSAGLIDGQMFVRFTGYDGHAYAIQVSSNLLNWTNISTNCPVNGTFSFTNSMTINTNPQFYRSVLLQ